MFLAITSVGWAQLAVTKYLVSELPVLTMRASLDRRRGAGWLYRAGDGTESAGRAKAVPRLMLAALLNVTAGWADGTGVLCCRPAKPP